MANIDGFLWQNRPVPDRNNPTQRICIIDRGGAIYKPNSALTDWTSDTTEVAQLNAATGDLDPDVLPATVLATATLALAKVTGGGTDGTVTIVNGLVTAYTAPT